MFALIDSLISVRELDFNVDRFRLLVVTSAVIFVISYAINYIIKQIKFDKQINRQIANIRRQSILFGNLNIITPGMKRGLEVGEGNCNANSSLAN